MRRALKVTEDHVDKLLINLSQSIHQLPIYGKKFTHCKKKILPKLRQAVFNNPQISGIVISDLNSQTLCSTLSKSATLLSTRNQSRILSGPYTIKEDSPPFFLLQQRLGEYHITIYFLIDILENALSIDLPVSQSITLYNEVEKKGIISLIKNPKTTLWQTTTLDEKKSQAPENLITKTTLQAIDGLSITASANPNLVKNSILRSEIVLTILWLTSSILLYLAISQLIQRRYSLHGNLKYALKKDHFFPLYQPIFNTQKGRYVGAEVLLRWKTEQNEILMPETFIEEAEKTGLIIPITMRLCEMALKDYASILNTHSSFYLAFNVSTMHFTTPQFFSKFIKIVKKHKVNPKNIILELTERALFNKNDHVFTETMEHLRSMGFSLAIDDFGTGHSNISYLQHFPFNYLKIDKLFVHSIGTGAITESLIETIIQMANHLHLTIIAEGIETSAQADFLKSNHVFYLQGWYYAKALSIDKLHTLLQGH